MRLYSFVNGLYLNQLQYGLQTAHCVSNLSLQNNDFYKEWATNHKTIIILDAINSKGVRQAFHNLCNFSSGHLMEVIPVTCFYEDADSLDGAITAAACVLPERIYNVSVTRQEAQEIMANLEANKWKINPYISDEGREYLLSCMIKTYNLAPR